MTKNKISQKKNLSSIQVIKTLQVLMQGNFSMNELITRLNEQEPAPIFNNSVISKYINTCRYCGIAVPKINNKYCIASVPFGMDLTVSEIDILKSLQLYVKKVLPTKCSKTIDSFVEKVSRFSNKKISTVQKENLTIPLEIFERAIAQKRKIKLHFKNKAILECIPLNITHKDNKTYFNVFNKKIRNIDTTRLSGIEQTTEKYVNPYNAEQTTIFKLKGALAKRYEARENEKVELNLDGTITVTNRNENKELLFSRLLRYDDKCEVLYPKAYREDMKNLINNTLNNYEDK